MEDLAHESLLILAKRAKQDPAHLLACIDSTQQMEMSGIILPMLQTILTQKSNDCHLPSLLRCIMILLIDEYKGSDNMVNVLSDVINIFEAAATEIEVIRHGSSEEDRSHIQWWSNVAYKITLCSPSRTSLEELVSLSAVCLRFLNKHIEHADAADVEQLNRRKLTCYFVSMTALITRARSENNTAEYATQSYLNAQQQIQGFNAALKEHHVPRDRAEAQRIFEIHKLNLECVLRLQQWDRLEEALRSCLSLEHVECWESMVDLLLIVHDEMNATAHDPSTGGLLIEMLQKMINETWRRDKDISKVSRWVRLTFVICIDDTDSNFSLKLLQQAENIAAGGQAGKHASYPEQELYWLASTSFNHALDLMACGQTEAAQNWIESAIELARLISDHGSLYDVLRSKRDVALDRCKSHRLST